MNLADFLSEECVLFLDTRDKKTTLESMIQAAFNANKIKDKEEFESSIKAREAIMSTGIGIGVAVPHAKLSNINSFFIVVAILKKGVDWDAIDRKPVQLVFLIGGPENRQTDYLKILSKLVLLTKNQSRREKIIQAEKAQDVLALFENL